MQKITKFFTKLAGYFNYIAMASCFLMMLLMTADVVCRYILGASILGTYEIAENMLVTIVAFSLADCQVKKRHIHVDILTNVLPFRIRKVVDALCMLISLAFLWICTQSQFQQVALIKASNYSSTVLQFPLWPFHLALAIGVALLFVAFLVDIINDLIAMFSKKKPESSAA